MKFTLNTGFISNQAQVLAKQERAGRFMGGAEFSGVDTTRIPATPEDRVLFYRVSKQTWLAMVVSWGPRKENKVIKRFRTVSKKELQPVESLQALIELVSQGASTPHEFLAEDTQEWLDGIQRVKNAEWKAICDEERRRQHYVYESLGIEDDPEAQRIYRLRQASLKLQEAQDLHNLEHDAANQITMAEAYVGADLEYVEYKKRTGVNW